MKTGKVGNLRDGTQVTVLEVTRVLSKTPKIVATSWLDSSQSGHEVYRLADGRVILADFIELTDETVEVRRKAVPETDSDSVSDTDGEEEPDVELTELQLPTFARLPAEEDAVTVITLTDPDSPDSEDGSDPEIDQEMEEV